MQFDILKRICEEQDFTACREWYLVNGPNAYLIDLLQEETAELFADKMYESILEYLRVLPPSQPNQEVVQPEPPPPASDQQSKGSVLDSLYYKAGQHFKRMKETRLGIFNDDDREVRRKAALDTLKWQDKNKAVWRDIEFYKKHGCLPNSGETSSVKHWSVDDLVKQQNRDDNYIRKYSSKKVTDHVRKELKVRRARLRKINREISIR